jgi:hypothetical protein
MAEQFVQLLKINLHLCDIANYLARVVYNNIAFISKIYIKFIKWIVSNDIMKNDNRKDKKIKNPRLFDYLIASEIT